MSWVGHTAGKETRKQDLGGSSGWGSGQELGVWAAVAGDVARGLGGQTRL